MLTDQPWHHDASNTIGLKHSHMHDSCYKDIGRPDRDLHETIEDLADQTCCNFITCQKSSTLLYLRFNN